MDPPEKPDTFNPFQATSRRLIPVNAAYPIGAAPATSVSVVVAGEGKTVGAQYSDKTPTHLDRGIAEAAPSSKGSRRAHFFLIVASLFVYGAIALTVWCSLDPGEYKKLTSWSTQLYEARAPCNENGIGVPLLAGLLVPFLFGACYVTNALSSALYTLVHDGGTATPDAVAGNLAAMDAGVPTCEVYIETYHHESRGSGKNRRRVKVTTYTGSQPLQLLSCGSVPGTELAPRLPGLLRPGMLGTILSVAVGIDLTPDSEAALLAAVRAQVAEHGHRDSHFHVGWRFTCEAWTHKHAVVTGSSSKLAFWVSMFTLTHWLWTRYAEARVLRADATLVKRVQLAPYVPAMSPAAQAAYAAMAAQMAATQQLPQGMMVASPVGPMGGPGPYLTVRVQKGQQPVAPPLQAMPVQQQGQVQLVPLPQPQLAPLPGNTAYGAGAGAFPVAPAPYGGFGGGGGSAQAYGGQAYGSQAYAGPDAAGAGYGAAPPAYPGAALVAPAPAGGYYPPGEPAVPPAGSQGAGYADVPQQFRYAPK